MARLTNKVAVVTGASKGIGAAIAKELALQGASVVVNYASSKEDGDKVVAEIVAKGGSAIAVGARVQEESEVVGLFEAAKTAYGRVDILVNNAGVYGFSPLAALKVKTSTGSLESTCWEPCSQLKQRFLCSLRPVAASSI